MFKLFKIKDKIIDWCLNKQHMQIGDLHSKEKPYLCEIFSDNDNSLKFIEQTSPTNLFVKTPTGYSKILHTHKTVPYEVWKVTTQTKKELLCADEHILITDTDEQTFVKDLFIGAKIKTIDGIEQIINVEKLNFSDNMYDLELNDSDNVYYSNDILSHNSTTAVAYLLWYAIFQLDKTILIASNKNENAMILVEKLQYAYEELPYWIKPGIPEGGWNKHGITFDNKSKIVSTATSESSGRGMAISLLYIDEFAFVKPHIQEDFFTSIAPTLATGGACIMSSTPNGDANLFAQIWRSAEVGLNIGAGEETAFPFVPVRVYWDEPPGRDEKFKKAEIQKLGEQKWLQEYECFFLSSDALLIDSTILGTLNNRMIPKQFEKNDISFFDTFKSGETYIVGVDPATGSMKDFSVIEVVHFPSLNQVAEFRSNSMDSGEVYKKLKWLMKIMEDNGCETYFSVENNGVGEGIISLYNNDEHPVHTASFITEDGKKRDGMTTTRQTKMKACLEFKKLIENGQLKINSSIVMKEIKTYVRKGISYEAQRGSTDDCISAFLVITRIIEEMTTYDQNAFNTLYTYNENDYSDTDSYDDNYEPDPFV